MRDTVKLIIEIPKPMYENVQNGTYCGTLYKELKNGIPHETVTEFADRCKECGSRYGKLLKQEPCGDAISRQALLDGIEELKKSPWYNYGKDTTDFRLERYNERVKTIETIEDLCIKQEPSVTPTVIEDIKAEIVKTVEEEKQIDKMWSNGLKYALQIIDKHIGEIK